MSLPKATQKLLANYGDPLPSHTFPNGYPLYYVDKLACILCADCANNAIKEELAGELWDECDLPIMCESHLEGPDMECENGGCGYKIEAAYEEDDGT